MLFLWSLPAIINSKTEENEDQRMSAENYGLLHNGDVVAYLFKGRPCTYFEKLSIVLRLV